MRECSKGGCELSKLSSKLSRRAFLASSANGLALAASAKLGYPLEYPLIRAEGSHRDLGRQHGEQVSGKIQAHLNLMMASGRLSREELRSCALRFQPLFEKYCPHLLDEIGGLAEGARITLAEALAVNIRGELSHAPQEGCTAYVIGGTGTVQREMLAGQNSDMESAIPPLGYMLLLKPVNKPEVLMWTFGGMIGYHGMNAGGVAHFANALGGGPANAMGLPHYPIKRMMLECDHVDQVVRLLRTADQTQRNVSLGQARVESAFARAPGRLKHSGGTNRSACGYAGARGRSKSQNRRPTGARARRAPARGSRCAGSGQVLF